MKHLKKKCYYIETTIDKMSLYETSFGKMLLFETSLGEASAGEMSLDEMTLVETLTVFKSLKLDG